MEQTINILKKHGISPSYQRVKIFGYLMETKTHPTAYDIFAKFKSEIPSLSKTTVYNVLSALKEKNLVNEVHIEGHETRFDAEMRQHGHFKCSVCGQVSDLFLTQDLNQILSQKLVIQDIQFNVTGICNQCLTLQNNN